MVRAMKRLVAVFLLVALQGAAMAADTAPAKPLDPEAATQAYLSRLTPDQRARSDAYFEGGYWLMLWSFLYGAAVSLVLLFSRLSARMRDVAARVTRWRPVHTFFYWVQYLLLVNVVSFPLAWYEGFQREHLFGMSNQTFGAWFGDQMKGLGIGLVLGGLAVVGLFAILRRAIRRWWLYGTLATLVFFAFVILIGPVYLAPLFNKYTKLDDPRVRDPILRMAHANGIRSDDVYVVDASRQTKRVSANVSGILGTERVTLNDNLLNRTSLPEIEAVMGHEIGHYALHHIYVGLVLNGIVIVIVYAFLRWGSAVALARWGGRWGILSVGDPAALPLLALLASVALFVLTPVQNTIVRVQEEQADIFGLNAARQPDGFAEVSLKLGEYRKLAPGPVEEFLLFDHPSGHSRILMAMRWKAAQTQVAASPAP